MKKMKYSGAMIKEDKSAPSNCPREVIMKQYPDQGYLYQPIDDTMAGIDSQVRADINGVRKQLARKKY